MENKTQYTCPMHPEVVKDEPGKCPKCGMNLVPVKKDGKEQSFRISYPFTKARVRASRAG